MSFELRCICSIIELLLSIHSALCPLGVSLKSGRVVQDISLGIGHYWWKIRCESIRVVNFFRAGY